MYVRVTLSVIYNMNVLNCMYVICLYVFIVCIYVMYVCMYLVGDIKQASLGKVSARYLGVHTLLCIPHT